MVGIVGLRDLIVAARERRQETIEPLARAPLVVPETKDLGALLRELREAHQSLAVVVDEYGATAGLVSTEDTLEEIVGEIEDEYDPPDDTIVWIDEDIAAVAGSISIDGFNETTGAALPQDGPRTMAGLLFARLGRRPAVGDEVAVDDVHLSVEAVNGARIMRIR